MNGLSYEQLLAYIQGLYDEGGLSEEDYNRIILYILANGNLETSPRDLIQVRRGLEENLPNLAQGELGFTLDTKKMYVGGLDGNVAVGENKEIYVSDYITNSEDDSQAIRKAIEETPVGGVLVFDTIERDYVVGDELESFVVNKPMSLKGQKGQWIKIKDQSNMFHNGDSVLFLIVNSEVVVDGLNIDGNSRNSYTMANGEKDHYRGIAPIEVKAGDSRGQLIVLNTIVKNCHIKDPSAGAIRFNGGLGGEVPFTDITPQYVGNSIIENNFIDRGGQNSILNFTSGVKDCVMRFNKGKDLYYHLCRVYRQTLRTEIHGNIIEIDTNNIDDSFYRDSSMTIERCGIRVGHGSRARGSCIETYVHDNTINVRGMLLNGSEGISVAQDVQRAYVYNNNIKGGVTYGVRLNRVGDNVILKNNTFKDIGYIALNIDPSVDGDAKRIIVSGNVFDGVNKAELGGTVACVRLEPDLKGCIIEGNFFNIDNVATILLRNNTENNLIANNIFNPTTRTLAQHISDSGNNTVNVAYESNVQFGKLTGARVTASFIGESLGLGVNSVSMGIENVTNTSSVAIGQRAKAEGERAIAIGRDAQANGFRSVALGFEAIANGEDEFILGRSSHKVTIPSKAIYMRSPNNTLKKISVNDDNTINIENA